MLLFGLLCLCLCVLLPTSKALPGEALRRASKPASRSLAMPSEGVCRRGANCYTCVLHHGFCLLQAHWSPQVLGSSKRTKGGMPVTTATWSSSSMTTLLVVLQLVSQSGSSCRRRCLWWTHCSKLPSGNSLRSCRLPHRSDIRVLHCTAIQVVLPLPDPVLWLGSCCITEGISQLPAAPEG